MNRQTLEKIKKNLEKYIVEKEGYLETAESKDYPNDERIEQLQGQINCLQELIEKIEEYLDI